MNLIKTATDNQKLQEALQSNVIQVVATDHAPHTLEEKLNPIPKAHRACPQLRTVCYIVFNQVAS